MAPRCRFRSLRLDLALPLLAAMLLAHAPAGAQGDPADAEARPPERFRDAAPAPLPEVPTPPIGADAPLALDEAIRVTLDADPAVRLEEANVAFRAGLLQEASGFFDHALLSTASFEYFKGELRAAVRRNEVQRRDDLAESLAGDREELAGTEAALDEIRGLQADPEGFRVSDADLQLQIDLINSEIRSVDDPAIQQELLDLRAEAIDDALSDTQLLVDSLRQSIDMDQQALDDLGAAPDEEEIWVARLNLSYLMPFRQGFTLTPFVELTAESDDFVDKPVAVEEGGKGIEDLYRTTIGFSFDAPLLRGAGRATNTAFERSAGVELAAARERLRDVTSLEVLSTVLAFWDAVAAQRTVEVLEDSIAVQGRLSGVTRSLIEADELPASENARSRAREAELGGQLESARRRAHETRVALAEAVGFAVDAESGGSASGRVPRPTAELPRAETFGEPEALDVGALIDAALDQRHDVRAAALRAESAAILAEAAEHDLRPRLDLGTQLYFNSISEDAVDEAITGRWVGPSFSVSLDLEAPIANNVQRGRLLQAEASRATRDIELADARRLVANGTVRLVGSLTDTLRGLEFADASVRAYRDSLDADLELFGFGESTLIDTLLTEQRWTEAQLSLISGRQQLARLLVLLRYQTGELVRADGADEQVDVESLLTLDRPAS